MWKRKNQAEIGEMLDDLVLRYKERQKHGFIGGSAVMFGLSVLFNIFIFEAATPFLHTQIPIVLEIVIRILLLFLVLEILMSILFLVGDHKYYKMNGNEKKEYLFNNMKEKSSKMCPSCGLFYDKHELICSKCGSDLAMSYEYEWIDDEAILK